MTQTRQTQAHGTRHPGELAVRERLDVPGALDPRLPTVRPTLDPRIALFLMHQHMIVITALAPDGRIWSTAWAGPQGFILPTGPGELTIEHAGTAPGDPVAPLLTERTPVGLICVDFTTRARVRVNGTVLEGGDGRLILHTEQVYGNCQKYIPLRTPRPAPARTNAAPRTAIGDTLTETQIATLRRTGSFFIGTGVPGTGADASHRGGNPGFLHAPTPRTLRWPDYPGNRMFMTLGNLELHPHAGIVVPDGETGTLLHISGTAHVLWGPADNPADRHVELTIDRIIEREHALPLRWTHHSHSPANPPIEHEP